MSTPPIALAAEGLTLAYRAFALTDVSLRVSRGEYFVLLGPTGCGKTLCIELLCGLRRPDAGRVLIGGEDVTHRDPARRGIGYVPQDQALLPFMSVRDNIGFGLAARRIPAAEIRTRVDEMLELLGIAHLAERRPANLSGGERQRVALGRALAVRPAILLLDEPLSAIDEETRDALIDDLRRVHRRLGTTTLHVCHSLEEAMRLADRLAILRQGRVVQTGTPEEVCARPADLFVARFLRLKNLLAGEVRAGVFHVGAVAVRSVPLPDGPAVATFPLKHLRLERALPAEDPEWLVLRAIRQASVGPASMPELRLGGAVELGVAGIFPTEEWPVGGAVYLRVPRAAVHVVPG